jgi:transcriptional regulator of acetoin/glycerol metabolism
MAEERAGKLGAGTWSVETRAESISISRHMAVGRILWTFFTAPLCIIYGALGILRVVAGSRRAVAGSRRGIAAGRGVDTNRR